MFGCDQHRVHFRNRYPGQQYTCFGSSSRREPTSAMFRPTSGAQVTVCSSRAVGERLHPGTSAPAARKYVAVPGLARLLGGRLQSAGYRSTETDGSWPSSGVGTRASPATSIRCALSAPDLLVNDLGVLDQIEARRLLLCSRPRRCSAEHRSERTLRAKRDRSLAIAAFGQCDVGQCVERQRLDGARKNAGNDQDALRCQCIACLGPLQGLCKEPADVRRGQSPCEDLRAVRSWGLNADWSRRKCPLGARGEMRVA